MKILRSIPNPFGGEHVLATVPALGPYARANANEPPLPPKVSLAQARHMMEAFVRGTPDGAKIAKQLARDTIRQLI